MVIKLHKNTLLQVCSDILEVWPYLLIHNGGDELSDSRQRLVSGVKGHRLPGEPDLEQKGDPMKGTPGVCAAGGRLAAVRKPAAKSGRRAGRR